MIEDGDTAYIYGPSGAPIEHITADGDQSFYTQDQLGSTTRLTDVDGRTQATYAYDAYGNTNAIIGGHSYTAGGTTHAIPGADTPFRYAGQYSDAHTGLQYLRARYYDPGTGQFLTRDPIEDLTGQPYSYANNNPLDFTDPSGLFSFSDVSDFFAGFGDAITFGGTRAIRQAIGADYVDYCSGAYVAGGITSTTASLFVPFGQAFAAQRAAIAARTVAVLRPAAKGESGFLNGVRRFHADETGSARVVRVQGDPDALGPHSVFKRDASGRVNGYTTYGEDGRAVKRFRGTGRPHGGMDPPIIYEPRPGKIGGRPVVPRAPEAWELPAGY